MHAALKCSRCDNLYDSYTPFAASDSSLFSMPLRYYCYTCGYKAALEEFHEMENEEKVLASSLNVFPCVVPSEKDD